MCAIAAAFLLIAGSGARSVHADAQEPVKYVDENGAEFQVNKYVVLKGDESEIGADEETWYVVNSDITYESNIKVKDGATVNLILCKGMKMDCKDNFTVNESSALKVWGETSTDGTLRAKGGLFSGSAAIGGATGHTNGLIEIHSGEVKGTVEGFNISSNKGAGIGAGNGADGGVIRILGGEVGGFSNGSGTGIGGGHKGASGKILISGGNVSGTSTAYGAGIGAGDDAGDNNTGEITITGGNVYAVGEGGAGIGGGNQSEGGSINISGGTITTISRDGTWTDAGACIGGGNGAKAGVINISGGDITANPTSDAGAGIGSGEDCEGEITGEIYITGGKIRVGTNYKYGGSAGIGGSNGSNGCHVVIRGGDIISYGSTGRFISLNNTNGGAGIGGGCDGNGGIVEIYGGEVYAFGGADAAGIGGGDHGNGGTVKITGGTVGAQGCISGAGIGGGETKSGGNITISGGTVETYGGAHLASSGAGIGGGDSASGTSGNEVIRITGGNVTVTGGNESAGIGGGDDGGMGNIVIDGGTVTATGGKYAAGIGTGQQPADERKADGSLEINGGTVTANGGVDGAGIGGGENADGVKVTINGGTVNANGSSYGAGIGGGENCKGGSLTVNGGIVTAVAGEDCQGRNSNGGSAIGSGQGVDKNSGSDVCGSITFGKSMMILGGDSKDNAVIAPTIEERSVYGNWRSYAQIRPCTHENAAVFEKDGSGHRVQGCPYCGLDQAEKEAHAYSGGKCTVCGYDQPRDIKVTFEAGDHGSGTMEPYNAYSGELYTLPECGFKPDDGYAFIGWKIGKDQLKKGTEIKVDEATAITALWKDVDGSAWQELQEKLDKSGSYTLSRDVWATSRDDTVLGVEHGNNVTLDMKGYTIDRNHMGGAAIAVGGSGSGTMTIMNGTITGAGNGGLVVNKDSSLTIRDCTITNINGWGIVMQDGGQLSLSGCVKTINNVDGGLQFDPANPIKIDKEKGLDKDSVISITLYDDASHERPTVNKPLVITSGLKGKGSVSSFSVDNDSNDKKTREYMSQFMIGENEYGEAVIGIPTKVTFDPGEGTTDEEHKMSDVIAVGGAMYTLPKCGFKPPEKQVFCGWKTEGSEGILPSGEKVIVTENMKLTACYEDKPQNVPVAVDAGEGHEDIAGKIADAFNSGKEEGDSESTVSGSTVNIALSERMSIANAEEKICSMMRKANIRYDGGDGKSGQQWTGTVGLKPLSGYSSAAEHEQDEMYNTSGTGGTPIGKIIKDTEANCLKLYVHWNTPVTSIDMTIEEPVCGTEVTLDEDGKQSTTPKLALAEVEPSVEAVEKDCQSRWTYSGGRGAYEGTFIGGERYGVATYIAPAYGYYIPETISVKVNGKAPETGGVSFGSGSVEINTDMTAVHQYSEGYAPTWAWNGYESATASFICEADESHFDKVTDEEIYKDEASSTEATHSANGRNVYTAAVEFGGNTYTNTITQIIPKTDHEWGEPEYTWFEGNDRVLAKRQCTLDPSHVETEVAETSSEEGKAATCTEPGTTKYTVSFASEAFSSQYKEEKNIPALGHEWGEWVVTKEATEKDSGTETRTCKRCKETESREILPADHAHKLTPVAAKAAGCTEDGNGEYWVCDQGEFKCGRYFADADAKQEIDVPVIPALGHDYQVEWKWSDDNSSAALSYVCRNDESHAGAADAEVSEQVTAPACEKAGKKLYVATARIPGGSTYTDTKEEAIPATGHDFGAWKNFDANTHRRICRNDASHVESEAHVWDEGVVIVEPGVVNEGVKRFTCGTCNATRDEAIPKVIPDEPIAFTADMVSLSDESFWYNGEVQKPLVTVSYDGQTIDPDDYTVTYSNANSTDAGTYTVTVKMKNGRGFSTDPCEKTYVIKNETPVTADMISLSAESFVFNGRVQKPTVKVTCNGEDISADKYTVTYSNDNSVKAGTYTVTVRMKDGQGYVTTDCSKEYTIKKVANTLAFTSKTAKVKCKKLKKKAQNLKADQVINFSNRGQGAQKYTLVSAKKGRKSFKKYFKINSGTGMVTIKKKLKKGTYKVKVNVSAAGDANHYPSGTKTVTFKVKVK